MAVIIRLQNLPLSANAASIRMFFQGLKIPDGGVNIVGGEDGDAFIAFGTDDDARQAMLLSGQKINDVIIKLFLSSKQEMQTIITEAQNRVLKRTVGSPPFENQSIIVKPTVTYFNPEMRAAKECSENPPSNKLRIIDHSFNSSHNFTTKSLNNNKENDILNNPPRPSEFSYKMPRSAMYQSALSQPSSMQHPMAPHPEIQHSIITQRNMHQPFMSQIGLQSSIMPQFRTEQSISPTRINGIQAECMDNKNEINGCDKYSKRPNFRPHYFKENTPDFQHIMQSEGKRSPEMFVPSNEYFESPDINIPLLPTPHMPERFSKERRLLVMPDNRYGFDAEIAEYQRPEDKRPIMNPRSPERQMVNQRRLINHDRLLLNERYPSEFESQYEEESGESQMNFINYSKPLNKYHDYNQRPQWLRETKVPFIVSCNSSLVRMILPPKMISPKTVFELFRNISILPKRGIKIEQDDDKRLTGYVYVLLINTVEATKALRLNNKIFRGVSVNIQSMDEDIFDKISDRCDIIDDNPDKPISERSPYHNDLCLEVSNIPSEVTETDLRDYFDIPKNVKKMIFSRLSGSNYCLLTVNDNNMMENILSFNEVSYRGSNIKVLAISKYQLQHYIVSKGKGEHPTGPLVAKIGSKSLLSCAKIEGLSEGTTLMDLKELFLPTTVPLSNIIINNNECIVDFVRSLTCENVIKEIKSKDNNNLTITLITQAHFNNLRHRFLSKPDEHMSVPNNDTNVSDTPKDIAKRLSEARVKNFPTTINNLQVKDLIRNFKYQPRAVHICYENGRNIGEAIITFKNPSEAVAFKDEFNGVFFMKKEIEVLIAEK